MQTLFIADEEARSLIRLPPMEEVDYRAACFCHNKIISIGYVCSVCLSGECCSLFPVNISLKMRRVPWLGR